MSTMRQSLQQSHNNKYPGILLHLKKYDVSMAIWNCSWSQLPVAQLLISFNLFDLEVRLGRRSKYPQWSLLPG